jgi:hypothetical protein
MGYARIGLRTLENFLLRGLINLIVFGGLGCLSRHVTDTTSPESRLKYTKPPVDCRRL